MRGMSLRGRRWGDWELGIRSALYPLLPRLGTEPGRHPVQEGIFGAGGVVDLALDLQLWAELALGREFKARSEDAPDRATQAESITLYKGKVFTMGDR